MKESNSPRQTRYGVFAMVIVVAVLGAACGAVVTPGGASQAVLSQCSAPTWDSNAWYVQGDVVSHNGHEWRATYGTWPGVEPGGESWWVPWEDLGPCGSSSTSTTTTTSTTTPQSTTTTTEPTGGEDPYDTFQATGPWAVSNRSAGAPGTPGVLVYHPSDLGANGFQHPVLTWANGTDATCEQSEQDAGILSHLASWGYVVVCAKSGQTHVGEEVLAAAEWMVDQNGNANSDFFGALDTGKVGAYGFSQGAAGASNATILSDGMITSTMPISYADPWTHIGTEVVDFSQIDTPVFFAAGGSDFLVSSNEQQNYYDQTQGPAARVMANGVAHELPTFYLGYVAAWFKYTLEDNQEARSAFAGDAPTLASDTAWSQYQSKSLP